MSEFVLLYRFTAEMSEKALGSPEAARQSFAGRESETVTLSEFTVASGREAGWSGSRAMRPTSGGGAKQQ